VESKLVKTEQELKVVTQYKNQ